jgi:3-methylcrotonyl-CoA carboxylase alpha subunit
LAFSECNRKGEGNVFNKILIANRGEIAVRVMRTCREMGIRTVAVYSDTDRQARHVREADEAYYIGASPANQSYLKIDTILEVARQCHAEAIHPGYGFLSENPAFVQACEEAGIVFIGPPAKTMQIMGSKISAKQLAQSVAVPTVPGYLGDSQDESILRQEAERIGYPVLIKASAGGGGKGMREVHDPTQFLEQVAGARREAQASFGDATVFLEKLLIKPRHIEIQVLGDTHGNLVYLGERDCSIQRRHQKIVEESPSTLLTPDLRAKMGAAAVRLAKAAGYVNAGTVEFIADANANFYFLEMNTRLQVEHGVTELVTGLDLVRQQIQVAAGEPLSFSQADIQPKGYAIEVRLNAEDPRQNFIPSTGKITSLIFGEGPGVRIDSGVETGDEISPYYDSMIAKFLVYGEDRPAAIARLERVLKQTTVFGITTNLSTLLAVVRHTAFAEGAVHTGFLAEHHLLASAQSPNPSQLEDVLIAAALYELPQEPPKSPNVWQTLGAWRMAGEGYSFNYNFEGQAWRVWLKPSFSLQANEKWQAEIVAQGEEANAGVISRVVEGKLFNNKFILLRTEASQQKIYLNKTTAHIEVNLDGQIYQLSRRQPPTVEVTGHAKGSTQFQKNLTAPIAGTVVKVNVQEGAEVEAQQVLIIMEAMKMELSISAPHEGKVKQILVKEGTVVEGGRILLELE